MRIALVYDHVNKWGGAERILLALHEIWPEAPLYTAVYNPAGSPWAAGFRIIPSFLNRLPFAKSKHELYPWLTPLAFESFNLNSYDLVISVTSSDAKGIITSPRTKHVCYCLTPTRYLWSGYNHYFNSAVSRLIVSPVVRHLRAWDKQAAERPDYFVSISKTVASRVRQYYNRTSTVIFPPLDLARFKPSGHRSDYFLVVARLVPYKKTELVVRGFNQLKLPLKIVGSGNQFRFLRRLADSNIEFLGQLTEDRLVTYYQNCRAVIFPQEEDFGLVPLEAQACGKPVIAYRGGGATETVIEGKTGLFFNRQNEESLIEAVNKFQNYQFKAEDCQANARRFGKDRFIKEFKQFIEKNVRY